MADILKTYSKLQKTELIIGVIAVIVVLIIFMCCCMKLTKYIDLSLLRSLFGKSDPAANGEGAPISVQVDGNKNIQGSAAAAGGGSVSAVRDIFSSVTASAFTAARTVGAAVLFQEEKKLVR